MIKSFTLRSVILSPDHKVLKKPNPIINARFFDIFSNLNQMMKPISSYHV